MRLSWLTILLIQLNSAFAQITAIPGTTDPRAIEIDSTKLICRRWYFLDFFEWRRADTTHETKDYDLELESDGTATYRYRKISWRIVGSNRLEFSATKGRRPEQGFPTGRFSLYELTDTTLVLGQILTSTGDWRKEFWFSTHRRKRKEAPRYVGKTWQRSENDLEGKVVSRYPDSTIASIKYFKRIKRKLSAEELFLLLDFPSVNILDSTRAMSIPFGEWSYFTKEGKLASKEVYDSLGKLVRRDTYLESIDLVNVVDRHPMGGPYLYVIGNRDSVQIGKLERDHVCPVFSSCFDTLAIKNLGARSVTIGIDPNPKLKILGTQERIESGKAASVVIEFKAQPGSHTEEVRVACSEWSVPIKLNVLGYHMNAETFRAAASLQLPTDFYHYKVADEYELIIQKDRRIIKTVPLSPRLTRIYLKKGAYQFTMRTSSGNITRNVVVK